MTKPIFCVHVGGELAVAKCPLAEQTEDRIRPPCYWQHRRDSSVCTYNKAFAESKFSPQEFADRVGLKKVPTSDEVNMKKTKMLNQVKKVLAE